MVLNRLCGERGGGPLIELLSLPLAYSNIPRYSMFKIGPRDGGYALLFCIFLSLSVLSEIVLLCIFRFDIMAVP